MLHGRIISNSCYNITRGRVMRAAIVVIGRGRQLIVVLRGRERDGMRDERVIDFNNIYNSYIV